MKKKKQGRSAAAAAATATATATATAAIDLKTLIHDQRLFFDKLIDLIPPRYYLPNDDADNKPWFQGLSKQAKASLKQQSRENIKLARRNRLDPDKKDKSSTLDLLNQKFTESKTKAVELEPINLEERDASNENENKSVTYEELRQRLRRKIEMLRGNRGSGESSEYKKFNERRERGNDDALENSDGKKRKRGEEGVDEDDNGDEKSGNDVDIREKLSEIEKEIEFGKVKIGDDEKKKKKRKKEPKPKELERLKRLEEVKKENPTVAEKESWKAAANRAMGVKVHDDPKLLKESMKREKRRKEKSSEKWKERVDSKEKMKGERQQKRRDNIAGKIRENKNRKIAKREKKLMRPGFEGRKDGYITKD